MQLCTKTYYNYEISMTLSRTSNTIIVKASVMWSITELNKLRYFEQQDNKLFKNSVHTGLRPKF